MAEKEPEMFSTLDCEGHSSQQSRSSDEISNADLLSLMKSYFSNKLSGIERNFSDTTQYLARKVKKTEYSFKFKGNQLQFELNSDILDNIGIAVDCIEHGRYTKAVSVLQDSEKVLICWPIIIYGFPCLLS
jgi:transposase